MAVPGGRTLQDLVLESLVKRAIKGDPACLKLLFERLSSATAKAPDAAAPVDSIAYVDSTVRDATPIPPLRRHLPRVVDELLAIELARGTKRVDAAKVVGLSERSVYNRLRDSEFKARVGELRNEWLVAALGKLTAAAGEAADTLRDLLSSEEDKIRLGAAQSIFEQLLKVASATDWQAKYDELKTQLESLQQEQPPKQIT